MIVYRVDHGSYVDPYTRVYAGPYASWIPPECDPWGWVADVRKRLSDLHGADELHPAPLMDPGLVRCGGVASREACGMSSLEGLHRWFGPSLMRELLCAGFVVRRYEVPDEDALVSSWTGQVLFYGHEAREV